MVQIRGMPEDVYRRLKVKAAEEGLPLSSYLLMETSRIAARRSWREVAERAHQRGAVSVSRSPEEYVRDERDSV
ncbi:MAG: hypothetical protein M3333_04005 [Actinomycetota bacterium]|nr:hypothetical protein [Actinomycetota bacterium]